MTRPYVIVNYAMTADGKSAYPWRKQLKISCEKDFERVHYLRQKADAVLVGIETVLADDPKLTVKEQFVTNPRQPLRVVLDSHLRIPHDALVLNSKAPTLIFTKQGMHTSFSSSTVKIIECPVDSDGLLDLNYILPYLYEQGVRTLLVEGGGTVLWSFFHKQLVDEVFVYIGSMIVGGHNTPTPVAGKGVQQDDELIYLKLDECIRFGSGVLLHYLRES